MVIDVVCSCLESEMGALCMILVRTIPLVTDVDVKSL